jgi:hypothetical protein
MGIFYDLHPVSIFGLCLAVTGILFFIFAFRGVNISQVMKVEGRVSQSAKWQNKVFRLITGFVVAGVAFLALGFALPEWNRGENSVSERTWHGTWDIKFCGEVNATEVSTVKFEHLSHREGEFLQARLYDGEGGEIGTFQRLQTDAGHDDFRIL